MNSNCAWRSGGDEPSRVWRLAGRLNPFALSNAATVRSVRWCSCRASSSASLAVLLPVHNRGDSGGPRVTGSTSVSNARSNSGSVWVTGFRPLRRTASVRTRRHAATSDGASVHTVPPPPCCEPARSPPPRPRRRPLLNPSLRLPPTADALARPSREPTSSITGANAEYFFPFRLIVAASRMPRASQFLPNQPTRICSAYFSRFLGLHRVPCRSSQSLPHGFVKILGPLNEILLRVVAELEPHIPRLVPTVEPPRAVCLERG